MFNPAGNIANNQLFATTGSNVLTPGGDVLGAFDPTVENDDILMQFDPPVCAVGFDLLFQQLDLDSGVEITLRDSAGNVLYFNRKVPSGSNAGGGGAGGHVFLGFQANSPVIAEILIDEKDLDAYWPDSNIGLDTIRLAANCPFCTTCVLGCAGTYALALPTTTNNLKKAEDVCGISSHVQSVQQSSITGTYTLTCPSSCSAPEPGSVSACGSPCFCIDPGEGLSVAIDAAVTVPILNARDDLVNITVSAGNLVSLPFHGTVVNAQDVCVMIGAPSSPTTKIISRNTCTGVVSSHTCGNAGPFMLSPCRALTLQGYSGTYLNPVASGAPPFPTCVSSQVSNQYCIDGVADNTGYSWWIDLGQDGVDISVEPYISSAPGVLPLGAPASDLAFAFVSSINGLAFPGVSAVQNNTCFTINVNSTQAFDLYVGPDGANPPACKVTQSGCAYNPVITLGPANSGGGGGTGNGRLKNTQAVETPKP